MTALAKLCAWMLGHQALTAIIGAVVIVASLWTGLNYYRHKAETATEIIAGTQAALTSQDRHAKASEKIQSNVETQSQILRDLPDAEKPIDPVRRDAIRHSIDCVRNHKPTSSCKLP